MLSVLVACLAARPDILLADFEGSTYGKWVATGKAFGAGPARGTLPNQMQVSGYVGEGLVNSFNGGDGATGTLTSPEFTVNRRFIAFRIGGGKHQAETYMALIVEGKPVKISTGPNAAPGGTEALHPDGWDVGAFEGKTARIEIVDRATGGWGHINADQIVLTDRKPPMTLSHPSRVLRIEQRYLLLPIKRDSPRRQIALEFGDGIRPRTGAIPPPPTIRTTNAIALADGAPDWWAAIDLSQYLGGDLKVSLDELTGGSRGLANIKTSNSLPDLYRETYRPQYHFSAKSGWLNDPNGLVYFNGEYHLFFQHDPLGGGTDFKLWGHAVSADLVHWKELPDALYPDELGSMWSGSAVVDWQNTSGLGAPGKPPLVLIYTAAGNPSIQCIASSTDGRTFRKYSGNPVIKQITPYNRDPKVMWYEPARRWIMVLYVEHEGKHFVEFHGSTDLIHWSFLSRIDGYFECPDFFELPVKGSGERKWVLTAANTDYQVGEFDGTTFVPETPKIHGHFGGGYYAPQTFSDIPAADGRRIQIGWMWTNPPDSPFTQSMSIPMTLELERIGSEYRLTRRPVAELSKLETPVALAPTDLTPGSSNPIRFFRADAAHLHLRLDASDDAEVELTIRGLPIRLSGREIEVDGHKVEVRGSEVALDVYVDRVGLECFVDGDYLPSPAIPDPSNHSFGLVVKKGTAKVSGFVATMESIWRG